MENHHLLKLAMLLWSAYAALVHAGTVSEQHGNLYYDGRQLTNSGKDSQVALSPDGQTVVFVHETDRQTTELWLMDIASNHAHPIVLSHDHEDVKQNLTEFNNPLFALNGKAVYFMSAAWVTSNAVHVFDLSTQKQHFITDGNSLELVHSGKYKAYLIVSKHKYHKGGGAYDDYWLVSPQGKEIKSLGDSQEQVDAFIRAN